MLLNPYPLNVEVVPLSEVPKTEDNRSTGLRQAVILIVDDERLIADTLSAIFRKNGFATLTAYDALSALELARTGAPEVLITDVSMPDMSGVELAIALVKMRPACKVLLFSAHTGAAEAVLDAYSQGHEFLFMAKPVHPSLIVAQVSKLVAD